MSKSNEKPEILVSTNGKNAPAAARAGVGERSIEEIQEAADARRNQRPGDYNNSNKC